MNEQYPALAEIMAERDGIERLADHDDCGYKDCRVSRHYVCAARGITPCYGGLQHQHVPKRSQGGKRCDVMLCAGHHDCIDNGTKYEGKRLANHIEEVDGRRVYRILERGTGAVLASVEVAE